MSFSVTSATSGRDYLMSKNLNLQLGFVYRDYQALSVIPTTMASSRATPGGYLKFGSPLVSITGP